MRGGFVSSHWSLGNHHLFPLLPAPCSPLGELVRPEVIQAQIGEAPNHAASSRVRFNSVFFTLDFFQLLGAFRLR